METKYCPRCKETLSKECFTKSKNRFDGVQAYCQTCMKKYRNEHYEKSKQAHYDRNDKTKGILRQYVLEIKNSTPCKDCGEIFPNEPWLTEFDHISDNKVRTISEAINYGSKKALEEEINKCELVCLICHRRRTAERGNWTDNRHKKHL